uniref:Uncharacterized protein n=1 Tax=Arundo donax TaxID=35708 RepID=A0A0A9DH98_ARUDO
MVAITSHQKHLQIHGLCSPHLDSRYPKSLTSQNAAGVAERRERLA